MDKRRTSLIMAIAAVCLCAAAVVFFVAPSIGSESMPAVGDAPTLSSAPSSATGSDAEEGAVDSDAVASMSAASFDGSFDAAAPADDAAVFEPGIVLVTLAPGATPEQMLDALSTIPDLAGATVEELIGDDLVKLALPDGVGVNRALDLLADVAPAAAAQPNYRYYIQETPSSLAPTAGESAENSPSPGIAAGTPVAALGLSEPSTLVPQALTVNDPYYSSNRQWALDSVNAPEAWQAVTTTANSKQVTVAVMDEGFLTYHEDLANVIIHPYDAVSSATSELAAYNQGHSAHGTHVAGIIAAQADNAKGIAGVAYNTASFGTCKIMPMKVADSEGGITTDTVVKAYNHLLSSSGSMTVAERYNVRVVNLSLGTSRAEENDAPDLDLRNVIAKAWHSGIVTVAAACNIEDNHTNTAFRAYPCDFPNVVGVIALNRANNADGVERDPSSNFNTSNLSLFRRYNESKNISAPGSFIYSTYTDDSANPAIDQYTAMSGTSMATPVVSGVLALMFKANPELTASQATQKLYSTAHDLTASDGASLGWDRVTGYGEADAASAVAAVAPMISGPAEISYDSTGSFTISIGDAQQDAAGYTWVSGDEGVAKVSQVSANACTVVPTGDGSATILARKGDLVASRVVKVNWPSITGPSVVASDTAFTCGVSVGGVSASATEWSFTSNDEGILKVLPGGQVQSVSEGRASLTATNMVNGFSVSKIVTVADGLDISLLDVSVSDLTYTGRALTPLLTVANGSYMLQKGVDYEVVQSDEIVDAGQVTISVRGLSPYTGEAVRSFAVNPAGIGDAAIMLSTTSLTYNGKVRKPSVNAVTAMVDGISMQLAAGVDYSLANPGVKRGVGIATVKGVGNFTGTATRAYLVKVVKKAVYQLYNRSTSQWFYTTSAAERKAKLAKGWKSKGIAFKTPSKSTKPVWRLYNPKTKAYRYTASAKQRKSLVSSGWKRQKTAFYSDEYKAKRVYAHYSKAADSWRYSTSRTLSGYTRKSTLCYAL